MTMTGTTVLVTGAAGNLGRAVAGAFAERGANLALVGHKRESLMAAFGAEDTRRLFLPTDELEKEGRRNPEMRSNLAGPQQWTALRVLGGECK